MPDEQASPPEMREPKSPAENATPSAAAPGWYLDGTDARKRYWDGSAWTEQYEHSKADEVKDEVKRVRRTVSLGRLTGSVSCAAILGVVLGVVIGIGASGVGALRTQLADSSKTVKILTGNLDAAQNAQAGVDTKSAAVDAKQVELDKRSAGLDTREAAIKSAETTVAANTFAGDGIYIVGKDIQPGQYKSAGGMGCYWSRLNAAGDDIIDNSISSGPSVVTVQPSDGILKVSRCAPFTKVG